LTEEPKHGYTRLVAEVFQPISGYPCQTHCVL